jgi:Tfp pilus assembly protein PilP
MNKKLVLLTLILILQIPACKKSSQNLKPSLPNIVPKAFEEVQYPKRKVPPRYEYSGFKYRDPFIPLNGTGKSLNSKEVVIPSIESLKVKGIISDNKVKMAILSSGGATYILENNSLYDSRRRAVNGITGIIEQDTVTLFDSTKRKIELKIR